MRLLWIAATLLMMAPLVVTLWLSFSPDPFFTLPVSDWSVRWFTQAVTGEQWHQAFFRSLWMAGLSGALAVGLAIPAAWVSRGKPSAWWALYLLPACLPQVAWAMGLLPMAGSLPEGSRLCLLVVAQALLGFPVALLLIGLRVDGAFRMLLAAAADLGASPAQAWWRVGLPRLFPAVAAAFLLAATLAFHEPVLCLFLCQPGEETLPALIWPTLRSSLIPVVAALASLTMGCGLVIAGWALGVFGRWFR